MVCFDQVAAPTPEVQMPETQSPPRAFAFADFVLAPQDGTLTHRGHKVRLQDQPVRLLVLLVERAGEVVTREEIQVHLWPENTYVEFDKSLRVAVSKIREALRDSADRPNFIETVPRRGYRFMAPVTARSPEPQADIAVPAPPPPVPPTSLPGATDAGPSSPSGSAQPRWGPRLRWALIAIPVALLLIVPLTQLLRRNFRPQPAPGVSAHPLLRRSVAVVGLRSLNADASDRWLSTALAEMLSSELSASDNLRVIPEEEVARAGLAEAPAETPSHESLSRYARQLGADMIVYGSFAVTHSPHPGKAGEPLRLDLRLENFSSDAPSLVLIMTGKSSDLFDLVTATGADLRQRLGLEALTPDAASAVRRSLPTDPEAAQFYAEGLNRLHIFDALTARDLLQKAAKIEPGHAGTHVALSDALSVLGYDKEALAEAQLALKLAEGLPRQQLLAVRGQLAIRLSDGARATEIFRSLFTFYPDNVGYGMRLASSQLLAGNTQDALATSQSLNWPGISEVDQARIELQRSRLEFEVGQFQEALASSDRANQLGKNLNLNLIRAQSLLLKSTTLERLSKAQESSAAAEEAEELFKAAGDRRQEATALLMKGDVQYDSGKLPEARATFESALVVFQELGNKHNAGITLERIGNVYFEQGAYPESRKYYGMALNIYRELHLEGYVASAIGNIANLQDGEGDLVGAIKSNQEGLALFQRTGDKRGAAVTLTNMGNAEMERGGLEAAQSDYKRSEEINRKTGYVRGLAFSLIGEGDVLVAQNDPARGIKLYREALKLVEGSDESEVLTDLHDSLGIAELLQGEPQHAINDLQRALNLALKRGDHANASFALSWIARAQIANKGIAEAAVSACRAMTEAKSQFSPPYPLMALTAQARTEIAKGQIADALRDLQATITGARNYGYLPIALEARILLAQTVANPGDQRRQLNVLAQEATTHGWKHLAVEAARR